MRQWLATYPTQVDAGLDAAPVIMGYLMLLADMPPWAVRLACSAARRGEYGIKDLRFAPAAGELLMVCQAIIRVAANERANIERALSAIEEDVAGDATPPPTEPVTFQTRRAPAQSFLDMCAEAGVDPASIPDGPPRTIETFIRPQASNVERPRDPEELSRDRA